MELRWYTSVNEFGLESQPRLQQKWRIRKGVGMEAIVTNEWRFLEEFTDTDT